MKKTMSLLLALAMLLSFAACGASSASAAEPAPAAETLSAAPAAEATSGEASGEASGESSGDASGEASAAEVPLILRHDTLETASGEPAAFTGEELGDVSVGSGETWHLDGNAVVGKLELAADAVVEADAPVVVLFAESESVKNGDIRGNVQFMSDYDEVVAVLHTNDEHGELSALPYVKGLADAMKADGGYSLVLTINGGDVFAGGNAVAHYYDGEFIPAIMAKVYDYMTWGNNDGGCIRSDTGGRSYGIQSYLLAALGNASGMITLVANQNASEPIDLTAYAADYPNALDEETLVSLYPDALALNPDGTLDWSGAELDAYTLETGENALDDGALIETGLGSTIGLFGVSTQGGSLTDAYFAGGQSTVAVSQRCADALRAEGADVVIGLCHTGWFGPDSTETSSNDSNSAQIALKTTGIDALVDAHTHSIINDGEGYLFSDTADATIVNQAACKSAAIGVMYLYLKDGKVVAKDCDNLTDFAGIEPDAEVQALVDAAYAQLDADGLGETVAETDVFLNGTRLSAADVGGGVRANETNLGDLVADGILYTAQQLWTGDPISIVLYPGFWVRDSVQPGPINASVAMSVFANPLYIYYKSYTAAELLTAMNAALGKIGSENNGLYQVAGLRLTYDSANQVVDLWVGDEQVVKDGAVVVGDDWTVGCAAAQCGGDTEGYDEATVIVRNNTAMALAWCDFLKNADYTIYPNEIAAGGRIVPAA